MCRIFQEECFCYINWPNFIVWLPLRLDILSHMCTGIVFLGCEIVNFENNLFFLIKLFFYMNKNSRQKSEYLENEESYLDAIKSIFHEQIENSASIKEIIKACGRVLQQNSIQPLIKRVIFSKVLHINRKIFRLNSNLTCRIHLLQVNISKAMQKIHDSITWTAFMFSQTFFRKSKIRWNCYIKNSNILLN